VGLLVDRLPGLRLAVGAVQVHWKNVVFNRGPAALPVVW